MIVEKMYEKLLKNILLFEDKRTHLPENYCPTFEVMDNGEIYILTNNFIYSQTGSVYYKFFLFDNTGKLITDPKYNYTLLPDDGYLMKIIIRDPKSVQFEIEYLINISDIRYESVSAIGTNFENDRADVVSNVSFSSENFNLVLDSTFCEALLNANTFFMRYLDYDI